MTKYTIIHIIYPLENECQSLLPVFTIRNSVIINIFIFLPLCHQFNRLFPPPLGILCRASYLRMIRLYCPLALIPAGFCTSEGFPSAFSMGSFPSILFKHLRVTGLYSQLTFPLVLHHFPDQSHLLPQRSNHFQMDNCKFTISSPDIFSEVQIDIRQPLPSDFSGNSVQLVSPLHPQTIPILIHSAGTHFIQKLEGHLLFLLLIILRPINH